MIQLLITIVFVATFLCAWTFVILYGFLAKWYRSAAGRHLFYFSLVVSLTYLNSVLRLIFPDLPYRMETAQAVVVLVFLVVVQRLWIFLRVLFRDRRDLKEAQKNESERQGS